MKNPPRHPQAVRKKEHGTLRYLLPSQRSAYMNCMYMQPVETTMIPILKNGRDKEKMYTRSEISKRWFHPEEDEDIFPLPSRRKRDLCRGDFHYYWYICGWRAALEFFDDRVLIDLTWLIGDGPATRDEAISVVCSFLARRYGFVVTTAGDNDIIIVTNGTYEAA